MATTFYMSGITLIVQYLTNSGLMAAGGTLNTYVGGSVNTPQPTFTDSTGASQNPNPMTLSSTGRPAAASGAPVEFWVPAGTVVKLVVTDALGNQLVILDNVPSLNDPTNQSNSLQVLLASAASSNASGSGPVGGADFVANAVKSYDVFADVRAANAPVLATGQTLNIEVQGGLAVGDGLGGFFFWNATTNSADDGRAILKPNSVLSAANGRWVRYYPLGTPLLIPKTIDQPVSSSTVLASDTQLTNTLPAGTYLVSVRLLLLGSGGTGQGWKFQLTFTGTQAAGTDVGTGIVSGNETAVATCTNVNTTITNAAISSTNGDAINLDFVMVVTASGLLTVQFAQNSSSANPTIMKAGSYLSIMRVA